MTRAPLVARNGTMALLWTGQILSQAGTRLFQIAIVWWLVGKTGAGAGRSLGLFMVAGALPALLLVKPIGRLIDSRRAKPLLVGCDLLAGAVVAGLGAAFAYGELTLPLVLVAGFLVALLAAVFDPTLNKALAEAVPPAEMEEAVAVQASTQSLASFGGAVAGAFLIDRVGIGGAIWLNAASFLVSAGCNALLKLTPAPAQATAAGPDVETSAWELLARMPLIKKVLVGFGLTNFFLTPILVVLPLYVKHTLRGSASTLGVLEAGVWLGLLAGTFAAGRVRASDTLALGAACVGVMGLSLAVPGLIASQRALLLALFCAGTALGVNNVKFLALFQEKVPAEFKGRFFTLMQAVLGFSYPAAYLVFGALSDWIDPPKVFLIQGLGILALASYFLKLSFDQAKEPRLEAAA